MPIGISGNDDEVGREGRLLGRVGDVPEAGEPEHEQHEQPDLEQPGHGEQAVVHQPVA